MPVARLPKCPALVISLSPYRSDVVVVVVMVVIGRTDRVANVAGGAKAPAVVVVDAYGGNVYDERIARFGLTVFPFVRSLLRTILINTRLTPTHPSLFQFALSTH